MKHLEQVNASSNTRLTTQCSMQTSRSINDHENAVSTFIFTLGIRQKKTAIILQELLVTSMYMFKNSNLKRDYQNRNVHS